MGVCGSNDADTKLQYLAQSPISLGLDRNDLRKFASHFKIQGFQASTRIYTEEDDGDEFYILAEGVVNLTALDESRMDLHLCTKQTGDFFGEAAVVNDTHSRQATVKALTDVVCLVLNRKSFRKFRQTALNDTVLQLESIMGQKMVGTISKLHFFTSLTEFKLMLLGNLFRYKVCGEGDTVFSEGDIGDCFYLVAQGEMVVTRMGDDKAVVELDTLSTGDYFGEIALMINLPRTATITAKTDSLLLCLSRKDFEGFLSLVPELKHTFEEDLKRKTARMLSMMNVPFLKHMDATKIQELARRCEIETVDEGEHVFNEDEPADKFYMTVLGKLLVEQGGKVVSELEAGKYFGEIALVTDCHRTASIRAETRCVLLSITKAKFRQFFAHDLEAYADFALKIAQHDTPLQHLMYHSDIKPLFRKHCESEFSTENLDFWEQVTHEFSKIPAQDQEAMMAKAGELMSQYIFVNSTTQVNISAALRDALEEDFKNGKITPQLFDEARVEVLVLMERDSFNRFKYSKPFKDYMITVGSYSGDNKSQIEKVKHSLWEVARNTTDSMTFAADVEVELTS